MTLHLVTSGDGSDGDEWQVHAIFTTDAAAREYIRAYNAHRPHWARLEKVEEWHVDKPFNPTDYPHDPKKGI